MQGSSDRCRISLPVQRRWQKFETGTVTLRSGHGRHSARAGRHEGRSRGNRNLKTDLACELKQKVVVTEGGRTRAVSKQKAVVRTLLAKALKGDIRATQVALTLMERLKFNDQDSAERTPLAEEDELLLQLYDARSKKGPDGDWGASHG